MKCNVILLDITHNQREPLSVGIVEGEWSEIRRFAEKEVEKNGYSTWTIKESKARKNIIKL